MVPCDSKIKATAKDSGSRIRRLPRTRSTQKLPSSPPAVVRTTPRMSATATVSPTAAETKFCTANPTICVRLLMVVSGVYDCQLVFVTKETAVLNATAGLTAPRPPESGSTPWIRCNT
ncbi:Uncharacterised protein [Mycobacteroides abscessus subsp. abscessus]|nr:Uncharacterised protein [Mycobacteroides abscessus subsp. abscessus]